MDSLGVNNELEVVNEFEQNLLFDGESYFVKLRIKPYHEFLHNNHENSVNCLKSLTSKVQKNMPLFTKYNEIIKNYIKEGIVETIQTHGVPGALALSTQQIHNHSHQCYNPQINSSSIRNI